MGRWSNAIFERYVVQGMVVGVTDLVRGVGAGVRGAQSGYLRSYALLLVTGFAGLGLYFLLQAHEERRHDPDPALGAAGRGLVACAMPQRLVALPPLLPRSRGSAWSIYVVADSTLRSASSTPSTRAGSRPSASATSSGSTGSASSWSF